LKDRPTRVLLLANKADAKLSPEKPKYYFPSKENFRFFSGSIKIPLFDNRLLISKSLPTQAFCFLFFEGELRAA
jgi:hypothetical protein